ncbi:MAG: carboxymuconolactone decarboxylase family protein [Pseudomonadota bacterium]
MVEFAIHSVQSTDGERRTTLENVEKGYDFVPNLLGGLAEAPTAVRTYRAISAEVMQTSFTPTERNVAWFAVNYYHNCHYCMPAHTMQAKSENVDDDIITAARAGGSYADPKLKALHDFVTALVDKRGAVDDVAIENFLNAGFTKQHVFEALIIITHKTLSNYANHLLKTPVDDAFAEFAWKKTAA